MLPRRFAAAVAVLLGAGFAGAQTGPQLNTVFPPGGKAGDAVEVTLSGVGFDGDEKLLFSQAGFTAERVGAATVDPKAPKGQSPSTVKFKVSVPKDATGTHDVRVVSKSGLSNPRAFTVGTRTEANEAEPNNDVGQAQKVTLETTVNGTISAPTDVDFVVFPAKAGQNVVVTCLTTSIDSRLSADILVSAAAGRPIAANRGYRGGDAVLDFKAPADGDYLVRVAQFAYTTGGPDHFYRLTVTTAPWVDAVFPPTTTAGPDGWTLTGRNLGATKVPNGPLMPGDQTGRLLTRRVVTPSAGSVDAVDTFPGQDGNLKLVSGNAVVVDAGDNDTADKAQGVKPPCDIAGRVEKKNDRDWYGFEAKKGDVWTLELFADRIGSQMDGYFVVTDEKGKVIAEQDDGPAPLSPNQFFTTSDDPARYRFAAPADGTYRVMVSTREAGIQFGVREQYLLRVAKEAPDFRLAVMANTPHLPEAGTLSKGGATPFAVFVFRTDGFDGPITLTASGLPPGVTCPPQVVGAGQTRGTLVLAADKDAKDWDGFVTVTGTADKMTSAARPFTVTWTPTGLQANQPPPNTPMLTRMDRGPGLAVAVRGTAPFSLTPVATEFTAKPGDKFEVTLKVARDAAFKDGIQVFSSLVQPGGKAPTPLATVAADKSEVKVTVDVPANLPAGRHSVVLRGQSAAPPPKGGNNAVVRPVPTYPAIPIMVTIEAGTPPKKK